MTEAPKRSATLHAIEGEGGGRGQPVLRVEYWGDDVVDGQNYRKTFVVSVRGAVRVRKRWWSKYWQAMGVNGEVLHHGQELHSWWVEG